MGSLKGSGMRIAGIGAALAGLYFLGALWGSAFETLPGLTPWFPPPGFTIAFLLAFGVRYAPVALAAEVASGLVVYDIGADFSAVQVAVNAVALTAIYAAGAAVLRHELRINARLGSLRDLAWLIAVGAVAAPILAGFAGMAVRVWAGASDGSEYLEGVRTWAIGDGLGVVSVAPALLAMRAAVVAGWRPRVPSPAAVAIALVLLAIPAIAVAVDADRVALLFAAILATAWIALTRGFATAAVAVLLVNSVTTVLVSQASLESAEVTDVQLFMLLNAVLALFIGDRVRSLRRAQARLAFEAAHDPLTGLANRTHFLDRTRDAVGPGREVAVLYFDVDRFKWVNDAGGHLAGDALLADVSRRLQRILGSRYLLARFGGDEFTALVEGEGAATRAVEAASAIVESMARPFDVDGRKAVLGASVGIALAEGDVDPHRLLRRADAAMFAAKGRGGSRYAVFDDEMERSALRRVELEAGLRAAIESERLELAVQPIIDLSDDRVRDVEVLTRWEFEGEPVPPDEFIALAEDVGLIAALGRTVLVRACTDAATWKGVNGGPVPAVAVNVSAHQLRGERFAAEVAEVLAEAELEPERLILELTESALLDDFSDALASLDRLRGIGVRIALDDFGKGFSAFSYLGRLPVDIIKIDREFLSGEHPEGRAIVGAIVTIARDLGLRTVAEGVETEEQLAFLRAAGVDAAQGYLLGRPDRIGSAACLSALRR